MVTFSTMSVSRRLGFLVSSAVLGIAILATIFLFSERALIMAERQSGVQQMTQMDHVTQQNAALVEEMAAAASSLKSQAQELVQTVAVFKLGTGDSTHTLKHMPVAVWAHPA